MNLFCSVAGIALAIPATLHSWQTHHYQQAAIFRILAFFVTSIAKHSHGHEL